MKAVRPRTTVTSRIPLALVAALVSTVLVACTADGPVDPIDDQERDYVLTPEERKMDLSSVDTTALGDIGQLLRLTPQAEGAQGGPGIEQVYTPIQTTAVLYYSLVWLYENGYLAFDGTISLMVPVIWANVALQYADDGDAVPSLETFIGRVQQLVDEGVLAAAAGQSLIDLAQEAIDQLRLGPPVSLISSGDRTTCALQVNGRAWCWGSGFLGNGSAAGSLGPVPVSGGLRFQAISTGRDHTCAVATDGAAWCWGYNSSGQLGNGTTTTSLLPVPVSASLGWELLMISNGDAHTCGVASDGAAWCWGRNYFGQLGNGTTTDSPVPVPVSGGLRFIAISSGSTHTCGVATSGAAWCWGYNYSGQLGDSTTTTSTIPVPVSGGVSFLAISSGDTHTCGVAANGAAWCWGGNSHGQVGDGSRVDRIVPLPVSGGLSFAGISSGEFYTCGVETTGAAWCWGGNSHGELGDGTTTDHITPVRPQWYLQ